MSGVTQHGIRYPDGASKAKNLGPELQQMAEDIDGYIGDTLSASNPTFMNAIDNAVEDVLDDENIVQAYPEDNPQYTGEAGIPMSWIYRVRSSPYPDTYPEVYPGSWSGNSKRSGKVAVLTPSGKLRDSTIPDAYPTITDVREIVREAIPTPEPQPSIAAQSSKPALWWARMMKQRRLDEPSVLVVCGSSSSAIQPGYVGPLAPRLSAAWFPDTDPHGARWSGTADFPTPTDPGLYVYSAAISGSRSGTYLTPETMDKIAALKPAAILHMIGANDYTGQWPPATYRANLLEKLAYLDGALTEPCEHILINAYANKSFNPPTYPNSAYAQVLADIADEREGTVYLDLAEDFRDAGVPGSDPLTLIGPDNTHATGDGYALIVELLTNYLTS